MFKKEKGFTLIELLIVIGIISILAAAIIVAISPGEQLQNARKATVEAQMQSIATAAYNCLVSAEGVTASCGYGDLDLPDINHPISTCSYTITWSGAGRVTVNEVITATPASACSPAAVGSKEF